MNLFSWYWLIVIVTTLLYVLLMLYFLIGWNKTPYFSTSKKVFRTKVAVIVPFFNEQEFITTCLVGLAEQRIQTTSYQIIAINDKSTDNSEQLVSQLEKEYNRLTLLAANGKGKKAALKQAVDFADAELIITTDADCLHKNDWLSTMVDFYEQHKPRMIIGPVIMKTGKGFLNWFQQLEFNSLIMTSAGAAGIGHPIMCNGANLAFTKKAFQELSDPLNMKYVSGDDVFLMHNFKKDSTEDILFLKSFRAAVITRGVKGLNKFISQRQRWASKTNGYKDGDTIFTASIVFLISLLFVVGVLLMFVHWYYIQPLLFLLIGKTAIDILFFDQSKHYFRHHALLPLVPLFEVLYAFYVSFVGLKGVLQSKNFRS